MYYACFIEPKEWELKFDVNVNPPQILTSNKMLRVMMRAMEDSVFSGSEVLQGEQPSKTTKSFWALQSCYTGTQGKGPGNISTL